MKQLILTLPLRNLKRKKEKKADIDMMQKQCIYFHIRFEGFFLQYYNNKNK